jgi:hypothetical protein
MFNLMEKHVSKRSSGGILADQRKVREILHANLAWS